MITLTALYQSLSQGISDLQSSLLNDRQMVVLKALFKETLENDRQLEKILTQLVHQANQLNKDEAFLSLTSEQAKNIIKPYMQNELTSAIGDYFEPDSAEAVISKEHLQSEFVSTLSAQLNALMMMQIALHLDEATILNQAGIEKLTIKDKKPKPPVSFSIDEFKTTSNEEEQIVKSDLNRLNTTFP